MQISYEHKNMIVSTSLRRLANVVRLDCFMRALTREPTKSATLFVVAEAIECNDINFAAVRAQSVKLLK